MRLVKKNIRVCWQSEWSRLPTFKIKDTIGKWESSYHENRIREVSLTRLRVNSVKGIHLIPRIEGNYPKDCGCGIRMTLQHVFFDCQYYIAQRQPIINILRKDGKNMDMKSILEDNITYCDIVMRFLKDTGFIDEI